MKLLQEQLYCLNTSSQGKRGALLFASVPYLFPSVICCLWQLHAYRYRRTPWRTANSVCLLSVKKPWAKEKQLWWNKRLGHTSRVQLDGKSSVLLMNRQPVTVHDACRTTSAYRPTLCYRMRRSTVPAAVTYAVQKLPKNFDKFEESPIKWQSSIWSKKLEN